MTKEELITELLKLPDGTEIWVNVSGDYEDHQKARKVVKGNASYSMCDGSFTKSSGKFNAIEIQ